MIFRRLLPAAALLTLSACAGMDGPAPPAQPNVAPPRSSSAVTLPPPRPAAKPAPVLNALRPSPRPAPEHEAAPAPPGPPKLLGLSEDEALGLLGQPAEETAQPPGKIWLYKAGGCRLTVHLFPDMEKGGFYALDYAAEGERDSCLGKVAGEARKKGGTMLEQTGKLG